MAEEVHQIKSKKMKTNLFYSLAIKIVVFLLPLITIPYVSRVLGPSGIGEYSYINSIVSYFSLFVNFGFLGYGTLVISKHKTDKDAYSENFWSIIFTRLFLLILSVTAYAIMLAIIGDPATISIYLVLGLTIFVNFFDITFLFQGMENFKVVSIINVIVRLIGTAFIFFFIKSPDDLLIYAIIQTAQVVLVGIIPWLFIIKVIAKPKLRSLRIWTVIKESLYFFLPTMAVTLCTLIDKTMLGNIAGNEQVGYYEQSTKIILLVTEIIHSFAPVFLSRISVLISEKKEDEVKEKISKMFELYFIVIFPAIAGLYAISSHFIPAFFGDEFMPSIVISYFLIPLIFFSSISNLIGNIYYGPRGQMFKTAIFYWIGTVVNITMNIFFIQLYAAKGAAISTLISEALITILFIIFSWKKISYGQISKLTIKPIIASAFILLIIPFNIFVLSNTGLSNIVISIIDVVMGVCIYAIAIVLLRERMVVNEIKVITNKLFKRNKPQE